MSKDGLTKYIDGLGKLKAIEIPRAVSASINKTVKRVETESVRHVSRQSKVPAKHIRRKIFRKPSTVKTQRSRLVGYAKPVSVFSLNHRVLKRGGISAAGRKFPSAFKTRVRSTGKEQIFRRVGKERMPIEVVSIPIDELMKTAVVRYGPRIVRNELSRLLEHEMSFRLGKLLR